MLRGLSVSLLAIFATAAYPQGERATITGTVTDSTQAIHGCDQSRFREDSAGGESPQHPIRPAGSFLNEPRP